MFGILANRLAIYSQPPPPKLQNAKPFGNFAKRHAMHVNVITVGFKVYLCVPGYFCVPVCIFIQQHIAVYRYTFLRKYCTSMLLFILLWYTCVQEFVCVYPHAPYCMYLHFLCLLGPMLHFVFVQYITWVCRKLLPKNAGAF